MNFIKHYCLKNIEKVESDKNSTPVKGLFRRAAERPKNVRNIHIEQLKSQSKPRLNRIRVLTPEKQNIVTSDYPDCQDMMKIKICPKSVRHYPVKIRRSENSIENLLNLQKCSQVSVISDDSFSDNYPKEPKIYYKVNLGDKQKFIEMANTKTSDFFSKRHFIKNPKVLLFDRVSKESKKNNLIYKSFNDFNTFTKNRVKYQRKGKIFKGLCMSSFKNLFQRSFDT